MTYPVSLLPIDVGLDFRGRPIAVDISRIYRHGIRFQDADGEVHEMHGSPEWMGHAPLDAGYHSVVLWYAGREVRLGQDRRFHLRCCPATFGRLREARGALTNDFLP